MDRHLPEGECLFVPTSGSNKEHQFVLLGMMYAPY
jgi:hypothetical protein